MAKRTDTVEYLGKDYSVYQNDEQEDCVEIEGKERRIIWDTEVAHARLRGGDFCDYFVVCDINTDVSNLSNLSGNIFKGNVLFQRN